MRFGRTPVFALLLSLLAAPLVAQERIISGTVTDSVNGQPLAGAVVSIPGTGLTASTRESGQFTLGRVPAGEVTVMIRAVGYRRQERRVTGATTSLSVALARDVFKVEELVITGQATGIERRNLPNAIVTVNAEDIANVPTPSIEQQLQGKVAGADIQTNGGAPGGGVQVRLRGVTSVNADAQPLYVVDGVIVSDVAIPSNQNAITAAAGGSNPALTQDGQVNRIADLNAADIESIEILKGASASAIYGGRASNGVVIITTKRGVAGTTRINITQRVGAPSLLNQLGSRRFTSAAEIDGVYGPGTAAANNFQPGTFFNNEKALAGLRPLSYETNASISGGSENTRYFVAGTLKKDGGIIENTGFQRQGIRFNLDQRLSDRLTASVSTNVLHTKAQRGLTNNDNSNTSYYVALSFTPSFLDLAKQPNGLYALNRFGGSNPVQTAALSTNDEDVWRSIASGKLDLEAVRSGKNSLHLIANGGLDFFNQKNSLFFPPSLPFFPIPGTSGVGAALLSNSNNLNLNLDGNAVFRHSGAGFSSTTSAGAQYVRRDLDINRTVSRNLVGDQSNVDAGTVIQVSQRRQLIKNLGFYAQEELLLADEKLLLTAGVRADQSSLNADASKLFFFPKAAASYRLPAFGTELKVRAAYGESGNEPLYGQIFTPLTATSNLTGLPGLVIAGARGASDLRYERQREVEFGVDGNFLDSRVSLEATVFQKSISDLLLTRQVAPSLGITQEVFNGGKLRTRGVELALGLVPIQSRSVNWLSRFTFSANRNKITSLPVPAFLTGGFGTSIGAFRVEEGASATQIVGNDTLPDGSIVVRKIGDANPDFRLAWSNDFGVKRFNLHFLWDYQQGSNILNLTRLLSDFGQTTVDYADPIAGSTQTVGERRLAGFQRTAKNYVESATFVKLREVTISYELPASVARALWGSLRSARLSLSGRNLLQFTPYSGLDPEVSNFGNQPLARNIDVAPFPPSRTFFFSIDLGL